MHLGTSAKSFPELIEQLGIMRYGHRPRLADTFCGSGQIPFEAARIGCDVFASDLNPVACMLTWGALNIVGAQKNTFQEMERTQQQVIEDVHSQIEHLGIEATKEGWIPKVFLYCVEVRCPESGWMVPLLPSLVISKQRSSQARNVIAELIPNPEMMRYDIDLRSNVSDEELQKAMHGTVRSDGRGQETYMFHKIGARDYQTKISTLRGDFRNSEGTTSNKLRMWEKSDFVPRPDDIFQERLYAIQWIRPNGSGRNYSYEFRAVDQSDLDREIIVCDFVRENLLKWQEFGAVPDMRIESGYNTDQPIRERGWTYWHHLFNPRQLLLAALLNQDKSPISNIGISRLVNANSRLSRWDNVSGGGGCVQAVFDNQALNTLFNYGCRSFRSSTRIYAKKVNSSPVFSGKQRFVISSSATDRNVGFDLAITDPPYGDAVKYEEILEFFIAWLRKNPAKEFADWVWDSRRALAIKGEDEDFRRGMVASYKQMTECMPDNGMQVIMFTHQSGGIWADMANIVWASGLQVTAAWYVVTETESALRDGNNVKGTVLLVCRKRKGHHKTTRDDLAWEIQEEVDLQVRELTGLNQIAKGLYRDENVFEDADIQMAGYAAALRVLTRYASIDGRDMAAEAIRPRVQGETTFVDGLITFAVDTANQCLVPHGIQKSHWEKLNGAERFYLKLLDLEARGSKTIDNYQNFAKAFKVRDFQSFLASKKANAARLKSAVDFGRTEMSEGSELHQSVLRAVLYAIMELVKEVDSAEVLAHLMLNIPDYYGNMTQRDLAVELADYLAKHLEQLRPDEAAAARILRELVKNQRLG
jgi:putative DNA methylase